MSSGGREGALVSPSPSWSGPVTLSLPGSVPCSRQSWERSLGAFGRSSGLGSFQGFLTPNIPLKVPFCPQNSPPSPAPSLKNQVPHPGAAPSLGPGLGLPGRGWDHSGHCSGHCRNVLDPKSAPRAQQQQDQQQVVIHCIKNECPALCFH